MIQLRGKAAEVYPRMEAMLTAKGFKVDYVNDAHDYTIWHREGTMVVIINRTDARYMHDPIIANVIIEGVPFDSAWNSKGLALIIDGDTDES